MASSPKNSRRWRSFSLDVAVPPKMGGAAIHSLASNEAGLWAIAEAINSQERTDDQDSCARMLLLQIQQQVASGEDLTAAFLTAHGRVQRNLPDSHGARIIAVRHARTLGTLELGWVGDMHALLLRGRKAVEIMRDTTGQSQTGGYLISTERLAQLGAEGKQRPRIDRNLVHVQRGDCLLLASSALNLNAHSEALAACLRGFGNLEYKARKMQEALSQSVEDGQTGRFVLCQIN